MGYEEISVVDQLLSIVDGIVSWAIKLASIIVNFGITAFNFVLNLAGL